MALKFGRKPTVLPVGTLKLANYLTPSIAPPPDVASYGGGSRKYDFLGNDTVGDCVIAAILHVLQDEIEDNGGTFTPTTQDALTLYSTITGYDPTNPATDQGTDPVAALDYWKANAIGGNKIIGYASLDPTNLTELKAGVWLFGSVFFAWDVPSYAMDQFNAGQPFHLDPDADATIEGGHETPFNGYTADNVFQLVTWAKETGMNADFAAAFGEIPLVAVSQAWINSATQKAPSGFGANELVADLAQLAAKLI